MSFDERDASLGELYRSVEVEYAGGGSWWSKVKPFLGPGTLIAVGYMDPGNWATDIQAGSAYNYDLLFFVLASSIMAMLFQTLSVRLGLASRTDLAQACRMHFPKAVTIVLWLMAQIAICACDLAEVIGSALALKLLFSIPITYGVLITGADVLLVLALGGNQMRILEGIILALMATITVCFIVEIYFSQPDMAGILRGCFLPQSSLITDSNRLFLGVGILGATVMPHNLYLHSSLVLTRNVARNPRAVKEAVVFSTLDSNVSLLLAFFVNAAILVLSAATFNRSGHKDVASIEEAASLMDRVLGKKMASVLFGTALLASGQQSTLTGTLAGQVVMDGFLHFKIEPAMQRLVTRTSAIAPALAVLLLQGDSAVDTLLLWSQVVLSLQLPFAIIPLVYFTSSHSIMGEHASSTFLCMLSWAITSLVVGLNLLLIYTGLASLT
ncbi:hypothetical protein GUITHDRAFT_80183 [Guillardia theta CCMP2712]|uniref:Uncharacterized protein n=2 Tax=Guillardia theta TaxID=55529 RepID=L1IFG5_GUITC|nr:hypothetical protein GUITHDRAFT_80183 [Guillardia theta CCMP2712]EKX34978.1 hypothetical protein GUITHDRAFT_80183 [Guillardia theta CCMP2712]|eukprot:XP_005821958.1 hypothetical protein GUITHDRAFT_80183 [Guillardia theta CCMP2712]